MLGVEIASLLSHSSVDMKALASQESMAEVVSQCRPLTTKKHALVSWSFLDQELSYFDTTNPGDKRVFWAQVRARIQGPGRGISSESSLE